jgi:hypothetical protein
VEKRHVENRLVKKKKYGARGRTRIDYRYEVDSNGSKNGPMTVCVMSVMNTGFFRNKELHPAE